jgi:hypothetical protein
MHGSETVQTMPLARRRLTRPKSQGKARVTNGSDILPDVDGRSLIARRYRDIAAAILIDMGGDDACSESKKQLIRRFAAAAVLAEQMESKLANGEQIDISQHALLTSTMVRVARQIGIKRYAKDISVPSLGELISAERDEHRRQHHEADRDA